MSLEAVGRVADRMLGSWRELAIFFVVGLLTGLLMALVLGSEVALIILLTAALCAVLLVFLKVSSIRYRRQRTRIHKWGSYQREATERNE